MHERLRELRLALGLTQKAFGEKIGLQNSSIATYESGRNKPSGAAIKQICDRFRVNERWLRTGEGEMFVPCSPDEELSEALQNLPTSKSAFLPRCCGWTTRDGGRWKRSWRR